MALFVYPFLYGLVLSFHPRDAAAAGGSLANYARFFSDPFLYDTTGGALWIALPATLANQLLALPVTLGAGTGRMFVHVLLPLLLPGVLAALLLVLVRTIAMFELTFLVAGPDSQTLVVALHHAVFAAGVRAVQSVDATAVVYMATAMVWLLVALRFVSPTQIVGRAGRG